jgi:hypothetical protein
MAVRQRFLSAVDRSVSRREADLACWASSNIWFARFIGLSVNDGMSGKLKVVGMTFLIASCESIAS